jgi:NitT/TauT family transport system permease protein
MESLFALRGTLSERAQSILWILGVLFLLSLWQFCTFFVGPSLLPTPANVINCLPELHFKDALVRNLGYSLYLNFCGYIEAIIICIPIGFIIGLLPIFKGMFLKQVNAIRFLPFTAITGVCIAWFGIEDIMKIQFLTIGIAVYLLPVVIQRIDDVERVYQETAFTLGASKWQTVKSVFFPGVFSKLFDDIRVLVAISWTYIIVAEMINKTGGVGAMIFTASRQSRMDKVFAILFIIVVLGFIQDKIFKIIDKQMFPYKDNVS